MVICTHHNTGVVRGQLLGINAFLPLSEARGINSGHQAWWALALMLNSNATF